MTKFIVTGHTDGEPWVQDVFPEYGDDDPAWQVTSEDGLWESVRDFLSELGENDCENLAEEAVKDLLGRNVWVHEGRSDPVSGAVAYGIVIAAFVLWPESS